MFFHHQQLQIRSKLHCVSDNLMLDTLLSPQLFGILRLLNLVILIQESLGVLEQPVNISKKKNFINQTNKTLY